MTKVKSSSSPWASFLKRCATTWLAVQASALAVAGVAWLVLTDRSVSEFMNCLLIVGGIILVLSVGMATGGGATFPGLSYGPDSQETEANRSNSAGSLVVAGVVTGILCALAWTLF